MTEVKYNLNYKFGADLKPIPEDRKSMESYVDFLQTTLKNIKPEQSDLIRGKVKLLGEIAIYTLMLGKTEVAHKCLTESLKLIDDNNLSISTWAVHTLRFADVHRFKKDFLESETAFRSVLEMIDRYPELRELEDFAWQHFGKLKFDEGDYKSANEFLTKAHEIRKKKGIPALLESTEFALGIIRSKNSSLKKYK